VDQTGLDQLLSRARQRDPDALSELVQVYSTRVYGLLYRLTGSPDVAEDLMQETFLRLLRTIEDYEHVGRFESWLFRIAANLARDRARKRARRGEHVSADGPAADELVTGRRDEDNADPRTRAERAEAGRRLTAALQKLPPADREMILLRHYSELSFKEIAELLDIPLGTALARAHRALQRLRSELADEDSQ
jgi:RNA polymerase sigma-70 factor (ECF subfamily)